MIAYKVTFWDNIESENWSKSVYCQNLVKVVEQIVEHINKKWINVKINEELCLKRKILKWEKALDLIEVNNLDVQILISEINII